MSVYTHARTHTHTRTTLKKDFLTLSPFRSPFSSQAMPMAFLSLFRYLTVGFKQIGYLIIIILRVFRQDISRFESVRKCTW